MNQPELGQKIQELRIQKGITQKELADACNIDIRTIQRIESGEVIPRFSTLRLISQTLNHDVETFYYNDPIKNSPYFSTLLIVAFGIGIVYLVNFILYSLLIPGLSAIENGSIYFLLSIVHMATGTFLYFGLFVLASSKKNLVLQIALIIAVIFMVLFVVSDLLSMTTPYHFFVPLKKFSVVMMGINGILFGIGLLVIKGKFAIYYKLTGVLQLLISFLIIIPFLMIQFIGLILAIPFNILLLTILFLEYRQAKMPLTNMAMA